MMLRSFYMILNHSSYIINYFFENPSRQLMASGGQMGIKIQDCFDCRKVLNACRIECMTLVQNHRPIFGTLVFFHLFQSSIQNLDMQAMDCGLGVVQVRCVDLHLPLHSNKAMVWLDVLKFLKFSVSHGNYSLGFLILFITLLMFPGSLKEWISFFFFFKK